MKRIGKEKTNKLVAKGAILVDMRSPVSYRDGHLEGSVNLPLKNFTNLLMKTADKKQAFIIYSDSLSDTDLTHGHNYAELLGFTELYVADYDSLK